MSFNIRFDKQPNSLPSTETIRAKYSIVDDTLRNIWKLKEEELNKVMSKITSYLHGDFQVYEDFYNRSKELVNQKFSKETWKMEYDSCNRAPSSYQVIVENDYLRVLQVTIEPGTKQPIHHHIFPSVMLVLAPTATVYYDISKRLAWKYIMPKNIRMGAWLLAPEGLHCVENLDTKKSYIGIRFQLKSPLNSEHATKILEQDN